MSDDVFIPLHLTLTSLLLANCHVMDKYAVGHRRSETSRETLSLTQYDCKHMIGVASMCKDSSCSSKLLKFPNFNFSPLPRRGRNPLNLRCIAAHSRSRLRMNWDWAEQKFIFLADSETPFFYYRLNSAYLCTLRLQT